MDLRIIPRKRGTRSKYKDKERGELSRVRFLKISAIILQGILWRAYMAETLRNPMMG